MGVRETLAKHDGLSAKFGGEVVCTCGESIGSYRRGQSTYARQDHQAHQARAVLAALAEAGTVEWGVAWKGAGPSGVLAFDSEEDAREAVELGGLLSRLTLPWERAE
jgi:hypothetical protein